MTAYYQRQKKSYEEFLKKVNTSSSEYSVVNKCYSILKTHGYKSSDEFYSCVNEFENMEDPWNWY